MRDTNTLLWLAGCAVVLAGCGDSVSPNVSRPENLTYELQPSGEPLTPAGLVLYWDPVVDAELEIYNVYSSLDGVEFDLRGSTTSASFHDVGRPDLEYFVRAADRDGAESEDSDHVVIDERLALEQPDWIASTSLNGAVHVVWADNPFQNGPDGFRNYRLYSTGFSLDDGLCDATWTLEGTTVSPEFLAGALTNGVPHCFVVSAVSIEGWEGLWVDPPVADTPRPDARNVLLYRDGADLSRSGFRFFLDANGNGSVDAAELGIVKSGADNDNDFHVVDVGGVLMIAPVRAGTGVQLYSDVVIDDLISVDFAPEGGYAAAALEAKPGFGYVFEMDGGDQFARFGALRVTHVGTDFLIVDWSYQTDPGNPELHVHGGRPVIDDDGLIVRGVR